MQREGEDDHAPVFPLTSWAQAATGAGWQGTEPNTGGKGVRGEQSGRSGADKRLGERLCLKDERREYWRHPQGEECL